MDFSSYTVLSALGGGRLRKAAVWGIQMRLALSSLRHWGQRNKRESVGGVGWGKLVSLLGPLAANSWVVWTDVSKAVSLSHCSEKSSSITASRCGLQMWPGVFPEGSRIQRQEPSSWLFFIPPSLMESAHGCPSPDFSSTTRSVYHILRGPGGWINKYQFRINLSQTDASLFMLERVYIWGSGELSNVSALSSPNGSRRRK